MFVWDEKKRLSNLEKHRLDFADATDVYHHPNKYTTKSTRKGEERSADIAVVEYRNACITLVYVERGGDIRIISYRYSSRDERELYAESRQSK